VNDRNQNCEEPNHVEDEDQALKARKKPNERGVDEKCQKQHGEEDQSSLPSLRLISRVVEDKQGLYNGTTEISARGCRCLPT